MEVLQRFGLESHYTQDFESFSMIRLAAVARNPEIRYSKFLPCYLQSNFETVFALLTDTLRVACSGIIHYHNLFVFLIENRDYSWLIK